MSRPSLEARPAKSPYRQSRSPDLNPTRLSRLSPGTPPVLMMRSRPSSSRSPTDPMSDVLQEARDQLWTPAGIEQNDVERLVAKLSSRSIDVGELYFQHQRSESWALEDGIVKDGSYSVDRGVGVRAISGEKTGFAYAEDILLPALTSATEAARSIARQGQDVSARAWDIVKAPPRYTVADPIASM